MKWNIIFFYGKNVVRYSIISKKTFKFLSPQRGDIFLEDLQ